jgi:hypothetical protein
VTATSISNSENFFEGVPGPTPWYSKPGDSPVDGFHWEQEREKSPSGGLTFLVGSEGVVAVLNFYNYVMTLDSSTLLIWNQGIERESQGTAPVHLVVIRPTLLTSFGADLETAVSRMGRAGPEARLAFAEPQPISMYLNTDVAGEDISAVFPRELQAMDELLILCDSSAIPPRADGIHANLALLVAKPKESSYRLYPQDWFNSADFDFGYQWITRVARDPQTGRVRGEGIRIAPFQLDDTLRNIVKAS